MTGLTGVGSVRRPLRGILTRRADVASPGVTVPLVALGPFLMLSRFVGKKKKVPAPAATVLVAFLFNLPTRDVTITGKRTNRGKKVRRFVIPFQILILVKIVCDYRSLKTYASSLRKAAAVPSDAGVFNLWLKTQRKEVQRTSKKSEVWAYCCY